MPARQNRTLCPHCHSEAEYRVVRRPVSIEFRGGTYESEEETATCTKCGGEFDMLHLLDPLGSVYEQYRREHAYPTAQEIRLVRERMRLTEEEFGRLLGVCRKTIRLYEKGALPAEAHVAQLSELIRRQLGAQSIEETMLSLSSAGQSPEEGYDWIAACAPKASRRLSPPRSGGPDLPLAA